MLYDYNVLGTKGPRKMTACVSQASGRLLTESDAAMGSSHATMHLSAERSATASRPS